jgi:hypothetical protein
MHDRTTTAGLLADIVENHSGALPLGDLLNTFSERAFGLFLLLGILPAFLPLPAGAGAISGPLVVLAGLQLLAQAEHPWLPAWLRRRPVAIASIDRMRRRLARPLRWLERASRPRWPAIIDHPAAKAFTGLLLVMLGVLLALPIPLTNYPFGLVLLVFAVALIERDGVGMTLAWTLGVLEIVLVLMLVDEAAAALMALFDRVVAWL